MRSEEQALRGCPTCGTPVAETTLGLRDFRWLKSALPGRVSGADLDFVLEQSATGRILIIEMKPEGATIPSGQRLLLKRFVKLGCDVWVVWQGEKGDKVRASSMTRAGRTPIVQEMTVAKLRTLVANWWNDGFKE